MYFFFLIFDLFGFISSNLGVWGVCLSDIIPIFLVFFIFFYFSPVSTIWHLTWLFWPIKLKEFISKHRTRKIYRNVSKPLTYINKYTNLPNFTKMYLTKFTSSFLISKTHRKVSIVISTNYLKDIYDFSARFWN